jgi:alpha-ketoglutaric semialdehyde dehydrogenase
MADFLAKDELEEGIFGPTTLLIHYGSANDLTAVAEKLHGYLTATIHSTDKDLDQAGDILKALKSKVGRILFNGYPTGVVCHARVHGGPFPRPRTAERPQWAHPPSSVSVGPSGRTPPLTPCCP